MASNLPVKQFTKALRGLPDGILLQMCAHITSAGVEPLPKPHNRGRMIKYIVDNKEKLTVNQVENPEDIEDRKKQVTSFTILMRIIINICGNHCTKYTAGTLLLFIHMFYDIDFNEKAILFKSGFSDNLYKFAEFVSEEMDEFNNVYKFKDKFKELVFDTIDRNIATRLYSQLAILAGTYSYQKDGHDLRHQKFVGHNAENLLVYSLCNVNIDEYDDSFDFAPNIDEAPDTLPNFVNATDMSLSSPPSSPTPVAPVAPAPAPAPAPVDNTNIQAPIPPTPDVTYLDDTEPIVKVVTDPDEWDLITKGLQRDENNHIVKRALLKQLSKHKVNKTSWNKLRKKHNLEGRWNIYIGTSVSFCASNPKQNQNLKYQYPLSVDPNWEYAYMNLDNEPVSDYPYGTIFLLSDKRPLPPPS